MIRTIPKKCELMIIGGGMAGMAASIFAADKGIETFQAGNTTELSLVSGLIDFLGVYPLTEESFQNNPIEALIQLKEKMPGHPLAKIDQAEILTAINRVIELLNQNGLPYHSENEKNQMLITSAGTVKPSYGVPASMMAGVKAYQEKEPCLIVDIERMKGFSSRQIAETLKADWKTLSAITVPFPDKNGEVFAESVAVALENKDVLERFANGILPHILENKAVGFPAVLGINQSYQVKENIEKILGVPVFEIPMLPPSVPGIRLRNTFETYLKKQSVTLSGQKKILSAEIMVDGGFRFKIGETPDSETTFIESEAAVLASGRFLGGGLESDYFGIKETVFGLPVSQPKSRREWHSKDFFDPEGHPVNTSGIEIDSSFRPLGKDGTPFSENLFAAGSIIANNDWMRLKSGAGSAIATASAAIEFYCKRNK